MVAPAVEIPSVPFRVVPDAEAEVTAILEEYDYKPYRYIQTQPNGPTFVLASGDAEKWSNLWDPDETNYNDGEVLLCHDGAGDLLYEMYSGTHIQPTDEHVLVAHFLWDIDHENIVDHMRKLSDIRNNFSPASERDVIACLFISRESDEDGPNLASASVVMNYAKETGVIVFLGDYLGLIVKNVELDKMYDIQLAALNKAENDAESERAARVKAEKDCLFISRESDDKGPDLASASVVMNYAKETGVIIFFGEFYLLFPIDVLNKKYEEELVALQDAQKEITELKALNKKYEEELVATLQELKKMITVKESNEQKLLFANIFFFFHSPILFLSFYPSCIRNSIPSLVLYQATNGGTSWSGIRWTQGDPVSTPVSICHGVSFI
eukprot:CAMPEP_0197361566 /NCGR_PEP_ID=MMETSP0893-20130614/63452_1 /TAXON_ID=44058 ORGANISM="Aureoumbra lagunensis, Strain CCMP1510" /NCGR_SAMPLE_ID=MMETSP0893 /ASSEMBLY_ACC=CAM_ASM_000539 /LENGTH=381 /DNA_ID=CAMNT_0042883117 /DNA_START=962 /DNA_END=2105 /DNA_ORIENTATION=-